MKSNFLLMFFLCCISSCVENYNGEKAYLSQCANCHGKAGEGLKRLIPPLAASDYLLKHKEELPCIIQKGLKKSITVNGVNFKAAMPGNKTLTETDIINIINYIQRKWYPQLPYTRPAQVKQKLKSCKE